MSEKIETANGIKSVQNNSTVSTIYEEKITEKVDFKKMFCAENSKPIPAQTSMRITALRFILIVLVVFIHNNYTAEELQESLANGYNVPIFVQGKLGEWIQFVISSGFGSCAVPLFFMFSAYLFFKKYTPYKVMLKKKARGLLLPYLFWIALNIILVSLGKLFVAKLKPSILDNPENLLIIDWNIMDYVKAFTGFGFDKYNHPFVGQLWFVRDLLILFLLSPILRIIYKNLPKTSLFLCVFIYISGVTPEVFASDKSALLFFTLGYFWAESDFSPFSFADSFHWVELIFLFVFSLLGCNLFFKGNSVCSAFRVLSSCLIFLKLSASISKNVKIFSIAEKLSSYSFWLFAIHMPFLLACIQKLWLHFLPMKNPVFCLLEYFGVSILVIVIGTGFGILLKKICPPLFAILNGGRK